MKITFLKAKKRLAKEITEQGSKPYYWKMGSDSQER